MVVGFENAGLPRTADSEDAIPPGLGMAAPLGRARVLARRAGDASG
jgi:hypothetical protein